MKLGIIGTGYVGLVNGACLAEMGHDIICMDVVKQKIDMLNNGGVPIYEPGLEDLISQNRDHMVFTTDFTYIKDVDAVYICVGTPSAKDGSADLTYVKSAANSIGKNMSDGLVVIVKSTVPIGTSEVVSECIKNALIERGCENLNYYMASNPEFLKEGTAVKDCLYPERFVVGTENAYAKGIMEKILLPFTHKTERRVIYTGIHTAEMIKYASNAMLATRISFMNEIANLCEAIGADVDIVKEGMAADSRIGSKFLNAGCGYGGSCFPKDVRALIKIGEETDVNMRILKAVDEANEKQKDVLYFKYLEFFREQRAKRACVLGLAFKPGTDDMREAPSINLIKALIGEDVDVIAYDPIAIESGKKIFGDLIEYTTDPYEAMKNANVTFIVTEWDEVKKIDWKKAKDLMASPTVIDGRNICDRKKMVEYGFNYDRIG